MIQKLLVFLFSIYAKGVDRSFKKKLENPSLSQEKLKEELQRDYENSKRYQTSKIPFGDLPVIEYDDIKEFVDGGLTSHKIKCFESTSGSSGQSKRIPYNSKILKSFSKMFVLWAYDIVSNISFNSFKFYFSITPQFSENSTDEGLKDDSDYLGGGLSILSKKFFVQVPNVKSIKNSEEFLTSLALTLISNRDLEIISIWSPTYLLTLMTHIEENFSDLRKSLKENYYVEVNSTKASELFPSLKFISSWGSGAARKEYLELEKLFEGVYLQRKGLLATEAPMTIPLYGKPGGVPLVDEVLYEFFDENENSYDIASVKLGEVYRLVISQKGGLLRYNIKDCVEVVGKIEKTPLLEFVGRRDAISDMVGEKIHELDCSRAIEGTPVRCLIPSSSSKNYKCFIDSKVGEKVNLEEIEKTLCQNIHYKNARELKQLEAVELIRIENLENHIVKFHKDHFSINAGDLKVSSLYYRSPNELISYLMEFETK